MRPSITRRLLLSNLVVLVAFLGLAGSVLESRDGGRSFQPKNRADRLALTGLVSIGGEVWASSEHGVVPLSGSTAHADVRAAASADHADAGTDAR